MRTYSLLVSLWTSVGSTLSGARIPISFTPEQSDAETGELRKQLVAIPVHSRTLDPQAEYRRNFSNQHFFPTKTAGMLPRAQNAPGPDLACWWGAKQGSW